MTRKVQAEEEADTDRALVFYTNKGKVLIWTFLALLVTAGGGVGVGASWRNDPHSLIWYLIAGFSLLVLLAVTIRCAAELFISTPKLTVSRRGITFRSLAFGTVILAWPEIAGLATYRSLLQGILLIVADDPRTVSRPQSWVGRAFYTILSKTTRAPLRVSDLLLEVSVNEIVAQMRRQYAHELKHNRIEIRGG